MPAPLLTTARETTAPGPVAPVEAVVALARRRGGDTFPFESPGVQAARFFETLLARAEQLSVLGVILVELARSGRLDALASVPGLDVAGHLRLLRRQAAMWDLERDEVLDRLSRAGVPTLLLKGAALRFTAYRDSAERAFVDIDILVPRDALQAAASALRKEGYETESEDRIKLYLEHYHHLILKKPRGFVVELHWALEPSYSPFALDVEAFVRNARPVVTPGAVTARVPSPEHMVLHLAHQNLEDGFSQLRRLVDVDRVVFSAGDFNWATLAAESKRMRVQTVVALTIRLSELLLGTRVPDGFIDSLGVSATTRTHLALLDPVGLVLEQRGQRRAVKELLLLWCLPDVRTRLRTLKEIATGERDRAWLTLEPESFAGGAGTRLVALLKLAAYQAFLDAAAIVPGGAVAKRRRAFWRG